MKTLLACMIALALVCAWPQSLAAGDSKPAKSESEAKAKSDPKDAKSAEDSKQADDQKEDASAKAGQSETSGSETSDSGDGESGETDAMSEAFGDDFIQHVSSEGPITYNETGAIEIVGPATVEGKDMSLSFVRMTGDNKKKTITATGSPVKIEQPDMRAECKRLVYDYGKKRMTLEGNPIIYRRAKGRVTNISGDKIIIDKDKDGNNTVMIVPNKGAGKMSTLDMTNDASKAPAKAPAKGKPAQKVDANQEKGLDAIKMPSFDAF